MRSLLYHLSPDLALAGAAAVLAKGPRLVVAEGDVVQSLVTALARGPRDRAALAAAVPHVAPRLIDDTLSGLCQAGLLDTTVPPLTREAAGLWRSIGVDQGVAAAVVEGARVDIRAPRDAARALSGALDRWMLERASPPTLAVVLTGTLAALSRVPPQPIPTLYVVPTSTGAIVALVEAGDPPRALRRIGLNRPADRLAWSPTEPPSVPHATLERVAALAARAAAGRPSPLDGALVRFEGPDQVDEHPLPREVSTTPSADVHPRLRPAPHPVAPLHLFSPVTGVGHTVHLVGRMGDAVAYSIRYRSPIDVDDLDGLKRAETAAAGGKAWSVSEALARAIWEAAERISGSRHPARPIHRAAARDLALPILPDDLDLFSDRQRDTAAHPEHPSLRVTERLDPGRTIDWVRAWPLGRAPSPRWVPAASVFYGYPQSEHPYAFAHSNGCAGGATYPDAILAGLLEIIERDAVAIVHGSRTRRPPLLSAASDPRIESVRAALHEKGRSLYLLDYTHDIGVPVCAAVTRRRSGPPGWVVGYGADLDAVAAARKAVLELAQLVPSTDSPSHPNPLDWADDEAAGEYLVPDPEATRTDPRPRHGDPLDDVVARVERAGFQAYVVDQTHPLIGVPTTRALVPGLLFFWQRHGGGRIGRVPHALGWRDDVVQEADYNPHPLTV